MTKSCSISNSTLYPRLGIHPHFRLIRPFSTLNELRCSLSRTVRWSQWRCACHIQWIHVDTTTSKVESIHLLPTWALEWESRIAMTYTYIIDYKGCPVFCCHFTLPPIAFFQCKVAIMANEMSPKTPFLYSESHLVNFVEEGWSLGGYPGYPFLFFLRVGFFDVNPPRKKVLNRKPSNPFKVNLIEQEQIYFVP